MLHPSSRLRSRGRRDRRRRDRRRGDRRRRGRGRRDRGRRDRRGDRRRGGRGRSHRGDAGRSRGPDARRVGRRAVPRIRAGHAEEVANAEDILADAPAGSLGETAAPSEESTKESSEPDVFDQRAAALAPLETSLARKLRRALADEQNEVLDRLRQGREAPRSTTWSEGQPSTARATPSPPGATSPERPAPDPADRRGVRCRACGS